MLQISHALRRQAYSAAALPALTERHCSPALAVLATL